MLSLTYSYRIYPNLAQETWMLTWTEQCRRVHNYALAERRDWIARASVRSMLAPIRGSTSFLLTHLIPITTNSNWALSLAKKDLPELQDVQSQVLQDALKRLDKAFKSRLGRGFGFPRFKKFG